MGAGVALSILLSAFFMIFNSDFKEIDVESARKSARKKKVCKDQIKWSFSVAKRSDIENGLMYRG